MKLTPHFNLSEFLSDDDEFRPNEIQLANLKRLARALEQLRAMVQQPIRITSGFRSPAHNRKVGGAPASPHTMGLAVDIATDHQLKWASLASGIPAIGGIGLYPGRGFIHLDIRIRKNKLITTWQQVDGKYVSLDPETRRRLIEIGTVDI
jgi:uncharacterized protein YcbK (DUF882 family)